MAFIAEIQILRRMSMFGCNDTYRLHQDSRLSALVILVVEQVLVDKWQQWMYISEVDIQESILVSS